MLGFIVPGISTCPNLLSETRSSSKRKSFFINITDHSKSYQRNNEKHSDPLKHERASNTRIPPTFP